MTRREITPIVACIMLLVAIASACGRKSENAAVPKPEAWPRIELPPDDFRPVEIGKVEFLINSSARIVKKPSDSSAESDRDIWFDITYPEIPGATLYMSLTDTGDSLKLKNALANRHQRMELNSGGAHTEITQLLSQGGWVGELALTRSSVATPLYIIAHNGSDNLLSGALYFNYPADTSPDSISPIVRAISRDLMVILESVRNI